MHTPNHPGTQPVAAGSHLKVGNTGKCVHDPIIVEDEEPSASSLSATFALFEPITSLLPVTLVTRPWKVEDISNCSGNVLLLKDLPQQTKLAELVGVLRECGLLKVIIQATLYQQSRVAAVEFPTSQDTSNALRSLNEIRDPFPERSTPCKLTVELLVQGVPFDHQPSAQTQSEPAPLLQDSHYGRLDQLYQELDMDDELESSDLEVHPPWIEPVFNEDPQPAQLTDAGNRAAKRKWFSSGSDSSTHSDSPDSDSENDVPTANVTKAAKPNSRFTPHSSSEPKRLRVPSGSQNDVEKCESSLRLPKVPYGGARRVLVPATVGLPMVTVSMRADLQFVAMERQVRVSSLSMPAPNPDPNLHVEEAIILGDTVVLGYDKGPHQVSLVQLASGKKPVRIDLEHRPHDVSPTYGFNFSSRAISYLAAMSDTTFVSGGYDKTVRLWKLNGRQSTSERLRGFQAAPSALACCGEKLLVGYGKALELLDVKHLTGKAQVFKFSNSIWHAHFHRDASSISVLEVDHLDQQVLLYDSRKDQEYNRTPDCALGYRPTKGLSRYYRGSIFYSYFVRGYPDHTVCLWDFRNPKMPVLKKRQNTKAFHTTFCTDGRVVTAGDDTLTFLDMDLKIV
ncbi:hypothetical protein Moror_17604 [Moniliophthora roreri MCA 2997]|uniref:Uncharacterized protein n=2 Tax=Moniliophthora roreri TaxID=221103 RepID=V2XY04_MONRO|nr:hypothetical protein Moror_17604 [Moniliophthora roreri MCA 2997]KAI3612594.1 hypothetical protein WG66_009974 [Moniliophthora roreri]